MGIQKQVNRTININKKNNINEFSNTEVNNDLKKDEASLENKKIEKQIEKQKNNKLKRYKKSEDKTKSYVKNNNKHKQALKSDEASAIDEKTIYVEENKNEKSNVDITSNNKNLQKTERYVKNKNKHKQALKSDEASA